MTPEERKRKEEQALLAVKIEAEGLKWEYRFAASEWSGNSFWPPLQHVGRGHEIRLKELRWAKEREAWARGENIQIRCCQTGNWSEWTDAPKEAWAFAWDEPCFEFRIPHKWQAAIDARAAGKPIEWRAGTDCKWEPWTNIYTDPIWDSEGDEFRPEAESSYRPWTFETCPQGIWLQRNHGGDKTMIVSIAKTGCNVGCWNGILEEWSQLDGTPAGEKLS